MTSLVRRQVWKFKVSASGQDTNTCWKNTEVNKNDKKHTSIIK